jgi:hypothetical protein
MKSSILAVVAGAALAGCSTADNTMFASRSRTVEYYRVFDIRTDAAGQLVAQAASDGIGRNIRDATLATPRSTAATL